MKSFSNKTLNFFLPKVLGSCQNCMNSANLVAEIHFPNERALSTGEP